MGWASPCPAPQLPLLLPLPKIAGSHDDCLGALKASRVRISIAETSSLAVEKEER